MAMRTAVLTLLVILADCGTPASNQSPQNYAFDQRLVATCHAWDERAEQAAHPDADTVARHDQLENKADDLIAAEAAHPHEGQARDAVLGAIAQARIVADDVYDAGGKRDIAASCWRELGLVQEMRAETRQRNSQARDEIDFQLPVRAPYVPAPTVSNMGSSPSPASLAPAPSGGSSPYQEMQARPAPTPVCIGVVQVPLAAGPPCP